MKRAAPEGFIAALRERASWTRSKSDKKASGNLELVVLFFISAAALAWGWDQHRYGDLTAEEGIGYALGIIGGSMMLALLAYPLRKRLSALRFMGGVRQWFRVHMILGILGPVLVILHTNFSLGSLNSTVAFIAMSVVALSGLAGRFFYARIHRGLYGRKASVREYLGEVEGSKSALVVSAGDAPALIALLRDYEERRLAPAGSFTRAALRVLSSPLAQARLRREAARLLRRGERRSPARAEALRRLIEEYIDAVSRAEAFVMYERLFALWHLLHLPLFVILIFAAVAHVIAVHMY
ncbi:MAG: pyridine nucleotide-disulfide oxidoreductase [Alphaproteobacteria bacterium]|nr:MAG: pyridine nucleotide-disulfide oxidoreductase [Alphaproteobacteria bacterium]